MGTKMQILSLLVAFLLFSTQIDASRGDRSMSKYFNDRKKNLSKIRGLFFQQPKKSFKNEVPILEDPQGFFCKQCLDVSTKARRILADASLVAEVSMLFSQVCLIMSSELGEECLQVTEKFATQIIPYLQILFLDEDVCNNTGICPNNTRYSSHSSLSPRGPSSTMMQETQKRSTSFSLLDDAYDFTLDEVLMEVGETRICSACRVILYKVRTTLKNPMTQAIIIKLLLRGCMMTNRKYIHKCKKLVTEYGPVSVTLLARFVNVVDLCNLAHCCQLVEPKQRESHNKITDMLYQSTR